MCRYVYVWCAPACACAGPPPAASRTALRHRYSAVEPWRSNPTPPRPQSSASRWSSRGLSTRRARTHSSGRARRARRARMATWRWSWTWSRGSRSCTGRAWRVRQALPREPCLEQTRYAYGSRQRDLGPHAPERAGGPGSNFICSRNAIRVQLAATKGGGPVCLDRLLGFRPVAFVGWIVSARVCLCLPSICVSVCCPLCRVSACEPCRLTCLRTLPVNVVCEPCRLTLSASHAQLCRRTSGTDAQPPWLGCVFVCVCVRVFHECAMQVRMCVCAHACGVRGARRCYFWSGSGPD